MKTIKVEDTSATASSVAFSTRSYEISHGKLPRGKGCWIFCPVNYAHADNYLDHCVCIQGPVSYGDAKRRAAAYFAELGFTYISVMP